MSNGFKNDTVLPAEKIISILSYFTFGMVGFVWVIIGALTKQNLKTFLRYHIFQSIFLSILLYIVGHLIIFIVNILGMIPFLNALILGILYMFNVPILPGILPLSIVQLLTFFLMLYLSLGALKGKYSYIPWVSDIIKSNIGR